jgi:hypothetical protein
MNLDRSMVMINKSMMPTLVHGPKLIAEQFPEYSHLQITDVAKQGDISHYCHSRVGGNPEQYKSQRK